MALWFFSDQIATGSSVQDIQAHAGNPARYAAPGSNKSLVSIGDHKMLVPKKAPTMPKPTWHSPWKLSRVGLIMKYSKM